MSVAVSPVHYFGDVRFVSGDPSNPATSRYEAAKCTPAENQKLMLDVVKGFVAGPFTDREPGIGRPTGFEKLKRMIDPRAWGWKTAPSKPWITNREGPLIFRAAIDLIIRSQVDVDVARVTFAEHEIWKLGIDGVVLGNEEPRRDETHIGTLLLVVATSDAVPYLTFVPMGTLPHVTPLISGTCFVAKAAVFGPRAALTGEALTKAARRFADSLLLED